MVSFSPYSKPVKELICLLGIDGSGKTTQAKRLVEGLRAKGISSAYVWCRWQPLLMKPFQMVGRAFLRRKSITKKDYAKFTESKQALLRDPRRAGIWFTLLLIDYFLIQVFPRVVLRGLGAKTLVCDRYLHDTVVDQAINFGYGPEETAALLKHPIARIFPRPTRIILIDVDPEVAFSRKHDIDDPEYLRDRRHRYRALADKIGALVIDGSGTIEEVHKAIWDAVMKDTKHLLPRTI
jgi:dTMP kinase